MLALWNACNTARSVGVAMKLEDQVPDLKLCQRLKELGMPQDTIFLWTLDVFEGWRLALREVVAPDDLRMNCFAAPTVAELGETLPKTIKRVRIDKEANARALLLICCAESGYVEWK